ncbi:hypothetical protein [Shewanella frigidimarina]|uniref:hypothetical protein n=1 Tax=Shewanella frigidimarina TaxID=56812 RepID=UPI000F511CC0|nr:hypothetical protein [Shewanella frigidimarina]RPA23346.1 hypothetical protein EGC78_19460 [Shewanella frigidimarina]
MDILLKILAGLAIAGLSSLFTVYLSLAKFRTEKWWEKRAEAYSNLLGVLHDAKAFSEENLEAQYRDRELTKEEDEAVRLKSKKAESEIYRAMDVGAFYLSDNAIACLKIYKKESSEASKENSWVGYLTLDLDAANKCLNSMINIAKTDLQIKT